MRGTKITKKKSKIQLIPLDLLEEELVDDREDLRDTIDRKLIFELWDRVFVKCEKIDKTMIRNFEMAIDSFDIPIADDWYDEYQVKTIELIERIFTKGIIPEKPEWIKLIFKEYIPYLTASSEHILKIRPITKKTYEAWMKKSLKEYETGTKSLKEYEADTRRKPNS